MKEIIIFILAFIAPFVYYRTLFLIARKAVFDTPVKTKSGMQIHHLHYGLVLIFIAAVLLLFLGKNTWIVLLLGCGLGLVGDEFIASLRLPEHRPTGLEIYGNAFKATFFLFLAISLLLLFAGALIYF